MTTATLVLLSFGLGTLVGLSQRRTPTSPRASSREETTRERAIQAQDVSARESQRARDLAEQWNTRHLPRGES